MLDKRNYELQHIRNLQEKYKKDPALLERVLYAFGLLEALKESGLPFTFKGGTCLMLLLEHPTRLSTDIDIIVEPETDINGYIEKAGRIFPFTSCEEQVRVGRNFIAKRHFKFLYRSPLQDKEFYILLDILFSEIPYIETVEKEIKNELLIVDEPKIMVTVPSVECILADKLTAFAPHTTGVPLGVGKSMEIVKQLFDIAILIDAIENPVNVRRTYDKVVSQELEYRGLHIGKEEVLQDTINACLSIIGRGTAEKKDYAEYLMGIKAVGTHILFLNYSGEIAAHQACKVMYLATCLLKQTDFVKIEHPEMYMDRKLDNKKYKGLSSIKKQKLEAYGYLVEAVRLLEEE